MKREDRLLKNYFKERVRHVSRHTPPIATAAPEPRNRIFGALAYAAILAAAVLPFSEALRENPLARTVTAVYRAHGMETRAEEGIERFFLTLKSHLEEEKNL